jgi:2'-5' RNA ligase
MRLFAALFPPPDVARHLASALTPWTVTTGTGRPALRWTDPEQWHVTLAFYGDVPEGAVPDLASTLDATVAQLPAPALRMRGAGSFSGRTLWVGVVGVSSSDTVVLEQLLAAGAEAAGNVGMTEEPRERRRAHLTLARSAAGPRDRSSEQLTSAVHALAVYEGPVWQPEAVVLVSSRLGAGRGGGPLHELVAELPFAPHALAP